MSKVGITLYGGVFGVSCLSLAMRAAPAQAGCCTNVSNSSGFNHANMGGYRPQPVNHHQNSAQNRPVWWNGSNTSGGNHSQYSGWWNGSNNSGSNTGNYPNRWNDGSNSYSNNYGNQFPWWNGSNNSGSNTSNQPGWNNSSNSSGSNTTGWNNNSNSSGSNTSNNLAGDNNSNSSGNNTSNNLAGDNNSNSSGNNTSNNLAGDNTADNGSSNIARNSTQGIKDFSSRTAGSATNRFSDSNPIAAKAMQLQGLLSIAQEKHNKAMTLLAEAENAEAQNAKLVANTGPVRYSRISGDLANCGCLNPDTASTPSSNLLAARAAEAEAAAEFNRIKAEVRQFLEAANGYRAQMMSGSTFVPVW